MRELFRPRQLPLSPDGKQPVSLYAFVWRTTGCWQVIAVFLALLSVALNVVPLELQRRLIDDAILTRDLHLIVVIAALFVLVILVRAVIRFSLRVFEGWLSESVILAYRRLIARLHGERFKAGRGETFGTTISILRAEVEQAGSFVGSAFSDPATHFGLLAGTAGYMLVVEPMVALVGIVFLIPQIALTLVIQPMLNRLTEDRLNQLRRLSDQVASPGHAAIAGQRLVAESTLEIYWNRIRFVVWKHVAIMGQNLLGALAPLSVLVFGGVMVVRQEVELGTVVAFATGISRVAEPMRELIAFYRHAAQTAVCYRLVAGWIAGDLVVIADRAETDQKG